MDDKTGVYSAMVILRKIYADKPPAHWKPVPEDLEFFHRDYEDPRQIGWATCSECGITVDCGGAIDGYRFCPFCGVKMEGDKNDSTKME